MARKNDVMRDPSGAARESTAEALETLRWVCVHGQDESARVAAATALLDRAYGVPGPQAHAASRKDGDTPTRSSNR